MDGDLSDCDIGGDWRASGRPAEGFLTDLKGLQRLRELPEALLRH